MKICIAERAARLDAEMNAVGFTLFWHRTDIVRLLFEAQGPVCAICRRELRRREATIDHVTPKSVGGLDELANFLLAHEACNHEKGCRQPDDEQSAMHARVLVVLYPAPLPTLVEADEG